MNVIHHLCFSRPPPAVYILCTLGHKEHNFCVAHDQLIARRLESSSIFSFYLSTAEYLPASHGLPLLKPPPTRGTVSSIFVFFCEAEFG